MTKSITVPTISSCVMFDEHTVTRERLIEHAAKFHRGDSGLCDHVVGLLQQIGQLRGFAPFNIVDLEPHRTHAWVVKAHATKESVREECPSLEMTSEIIDFMNVNGQNRWVALHYLGKRPEPVDVLKKVKQIGARSIGR